MPRPKNDKMFLFQYRYEKMAKDFDLSIDEKKTLFYMLCVYGLHGRRPLIKSTVRVRSLFETIAEMIRRSNKAFEVVQKDKW